MLELTYAGKRGPMRKIARHHQRKLHAKSDNNIMCFAMKVHNPLGPFPYCLRRLIIRSCEVSKAIDLCPKFPNHSLACASATKLPHPQKRYKVRNLMIRRLVWYWNEPYSFLLSGGGRRSVCRQRWNTWRAWGSYVENGRSSRIESPSTYIWEEERSCSLKGTWRLCVMYGLGLLN